MKLDTTVCNVLIRLALAAVILAIFALLERLGLFRVTL